MVVVMMMDISVPAAQKLAAVKATAAEYLWVGEWAIWVVSEVLCVGIRWVRSWV